MTPIDVLFEYAAIPASFALASAFWLDLKFRAAREDRPQLWDHADVIAAGAGALLVAPWAALGAPEHAVVIRILHRTVVTLCWLLLFYIVLSLGAEHEGWLSTPPSLKPAAERIRE